jgi:hypothetical protein
MPQYLSTDPNAGQPVQGKSYLSTDPNAGSAVPEQAPAAPKSVLGRFWERVEPQMPWHIPGGLLAGGKAAIDEAAQMGMPHMAAPIMVKNMGMGMAGMAKQLYDDVRGGNLAGAAGTVAGAAALPAVTGGVARLAKGLAPLRNVDPKAAQAFQTALEHDVPLPVGVTSGTWLSRVIEQFSDKSVGAAVLKSGEKADLARRQGFTNWGEDIATRLGPQAGDVAEAIQGVVRSIRDKAKDLKTEAGTHYDNVRAATLPPVNVAEAKVKLQPHYDELMQDYDVVQHGSSPGAHALRQLMEGADEVPLMRAERLMGQIKRMEREGAGRANKDASTRVAAITGEALEPVIRDAAGPMMDELALGRQKVREQHAMAEPVVKVKTRDDAASLARRVLQPGDINLGLAQELATRVGPTRIRSVGRAGFEEALRKANPMDQFSNLGALETYWKGLGPKTKEMFYGPELTQEIDHFIFTARRVKEQVNPSASAFSYFTMARLGAGGQALGNPIAFGVWLLQEMTAAGLSKVFNNPRATRALTRGFQTRPGTTAAKAVLAEVMAVAGKEGLPKHIPSPNDPAKVRQSATTARP